MGINVCFTEEQFDEIMKYVVSGEFETVQDAILHAIRQGRSDAGDDLRYYEQPTVV